MTTPPNVPGPTINFATWQSAIYGFSAGHELKPLRKKLFPERLPKTSPKLNPRSTVHWNEYVNSWCMPFPGNTHKNNKI